MNRCVITKNRSMDTESSINLTCFITKIIKIKNIFKIKIIGTQKLFLPMCLL